MLCKNNKILHIQLINLLYKFKSFNSSSFSKSILNFCYDITLIFLLHIFLFFVSYLTVKKKRCCKKKYECEKNLIFKNPLKFFFFKLDFFFFSVRSFFKKYFFFFKLDFFFLLCALSLKNIYFFLNMRFFIRIVYKSFKNTLLFYKKNANNIRIFAQKIAFF